MTDKPKRKSIGKKMRFEIFKRDQFTCQYCGGKAPETVLVIDHIQPVADGGETVMLNLITACVGCNSGKSDRLLSDDSAAQKMRAQAEDIEERRQQALLLAQWHSELARCEPELDACRRMILGGWFEDVSPTLERQLRSLIRRFGLAGVLEALSIAEEQYRNFDDAMSKLGGICHNRKMAVADPFRNEMRQMLFGIGRNFSDDHNRYRALDALMDYYGHSRNDEDGGSAAIRDIASNIRANCSCYYQVYRWTKDLPD